MLASTLLTLGIACGPQDTGLGIAPQDQDIVTGSGGIQVDPPALLIADVQQGYSRSGDFTVTSVGDGNLLMYELRIVADAANAFAFIELEDVALAPGVSVTYTVAAQIVGTEPVDGQLRIRTNDAENASYILNLRATPEGWVEPETGGDTAL